jgi:hypothetical protein
MRGNFFILAALSILSAGSFAFADGLEFSGLLDSTVTMGAGAGDSSAFSYGLEEFFNLRMQAKVRDRATFYGALNFIAAAGTYARDAVRPGTANTAAFPGLTPAAFAGGENYTAALELERLYFKISGEKLDFQGGLIRLAFGYGFAFGPMDFLNPRNPLKPDARPRAVLGADLALYPTDELKLRGFTAASRNPFNETGKGIPAGLSGEYHGGRVSVQGLYAFEFPQDGMTGSTPGGETPGELHRFGLSAKGDLVLGLAAEALYIYDPHERTGEDGLAVSFGADYSFWDGKIYILAEYLYSGDSSSTSLANGFTHNHYFYAQGMYRYNDYTSFSLGCMTGLEDASFVPTLGAEHELLQGFTVSLNCRIPLDGSYTGGNSGEFGPIPPGQTPGAEMGNRFSSTLKARLRF